ncbi:MAG: hypothetical protein ACRD36_11270, partial [Candidatus Acidiferrum sp.]
TWHRGRQQDLAKQCRDRKGAKLLSIRFLTGAALKFPLPDGRGTDYGGGTEIPASSRGRH